MAFVANSRGRRMPGHRPICWAAAVLLSGCAVGPNFNGPQPGAAQQATEYTPVPLPSSTASAPGLGGGSQQLINGRDIPAQWWTVFHSEPLDQLVRASFEHNPSMAAAQAALLQAKETLNAQTGNLLYPSVGAQFNAERERSTSPFGPGLATYDLFTLGLGVSYTLDLFGGNHRALEGLAAVVDYQQFQVEATYLTLAANVVGTAIREASLRAQIQATQDVLASQQKQLSVVESQFAAGAIARSVVLSQRTQVAQTRATLPALEKTLAQTRHQLSVFAGKLPSEQGLPEFRLESLQLPQDLPVTVPSVLLRQRPDIRASEALLHQASAQVGVAVANEYPQLNLSATFGTAAFQLDKLLARNDLVWSAISGLTAPIFNGGALKARERAAQAAYEQAQAQYRSTVLAAFQGVADALRAVDADAQALRTQSDAATLARESLDLSTRQYQLGAVSYLSLLDSQRAYQQTQISLVQAQAARYADSAALFQALGGGWWSQPPVANAAAPAPAN